MNSSSKSKGWRWLGLLLLLAIPLLGWIMSYAPSFSDCCGKNIVQLPGTASVAVKPKKVNLGIIDNNGKVTLTGALPSEEDHQNILTQANGVYGAGKFIDQITVLANSDLPKWWQNINRALAWLKSNGNVGLSQLDDVITLTGIVPSEAIKATKENEVRALFGGTTTINNLVTIATSPSVVKAMPEVPPLH